MSGPQPVGIAIIGSGFGGLGAVIALRRAGIDDFVILERAHDVGGTWRDNSYPGCACDVQSHLYSFSFALDPGWTHSFSPQPESQAYLQRCAREERLEPFLRFGHAVTAAHWDERLSRWQVATTGGSFVAQAVIMATGPLSDPVIPQIPGLDRFEGVAFHSARWDDDVDLAGRHVAVIGTGASAVQFVPEIQPLVEKLHVFQRTASWVLPRPGKEISGRTRWLYRHVPGLQRAVRAGIYALRELMVILFRHPRLTRRAERLARAHLARAVSDPRPTWAPRSTAFRTCSCCWGRIRASDTRRWST